jgi:hypothetical protein
MPAASANTTEPMDTDTEQASKRLHPPNPHLWSRAPAMEPAPCRILY